MKNSPLLLASLFFLLVFQACSSTHDFVRPAGEGTGRVYQVTKRQAWDIAKTIFRWEGADAIRENRKNDSIVASTGTGYFSYDAAICAWIDPVDGDDTMITVVSRHKDSTRATAFTEARFYWRFSQAVEIVNEGKPLPAAPPD